MGANIGISTLLVASHGADAIAVEPAQEARRLLEWNDMARERFGRDRAEIAKVLDDAGYVLTRPDDDGRLRPTDAAEGRDVFAVAPRLRDQLLAG